MEYLLIFTLKYFDFIVDLHYASFRSTANALFGFAPAVASLLHFSPAVTRLPIGQTKRCYLTDSTLHKCLPLKALTHSKLFRILDKRLKTKRKKSTSSSLLIRSKSDHRINSALLSRWENRPNCNSFANSLENSKINYYTVNGKREKERHEEIWSASIWIGRNSAISLHLLRMPRYCLCKSIAEHYFIFIFYFYFYCYLFLFIYFFIVYFSFFKIILKIIFNLIITQKERKLSTDKKLRNFSQ